MSDSQLVIGGQPFTVAIPADACNKAGNALSRISAYAKARGIVIKKDAPGFDKAKAKALRGDFNVIRARYEQDIRPVGPLIAADPNWKLVKAAPSKAGTSMTLRYRKVAVDSALQALLAASEAKVKELQEKLTARDVETTVVKA